MPTTTRLKTNLAEIRDALPTSTITDANLGGYTVLLKNRDGEIVDKQPLSRVRTLIYNYIMSRASDIYQKMNEET